VQYGFPLDAPNQQLFYNVTWFEEMGVPRPSSDWEDESWNWDSFLEAALALTDKDNNRWAFQIKAGNFRAWWIWVTANGGTFFNEDGTACLLNEPAAVEAFQFLADLIHVHEVAPPIDVATEMGASEIFEAGVVAMDTFWPAMGRMRTNIGDKFVWDVAPHPAGAVGKSTAGGGSGQVISAFSQNKEAAWEFVKFMATTDAVEQWTATMGIVPPLQSVAASDVYLQPGNPPEHISVFTDGAPYLRPDPRHPAFTQAASLANSELDRLWIGQASAQEVADSIVDKVNDLL
jgi:multiple sugar transport system substrate-binding protein